MHNMLLFSLICVSVFILCACPIPEGAPTSRQEKQESSVGMTCRTILDERQVYPPGSLVWKLNYSNRLLNNRITMCHNPQRQSVREGA